MNTDRIGGETQESFEDTEVSDVLKQTSTEKRRRQTKKNKETNSTLTATE